VPYSSLESIIEQNKQEYYIALRHTQKTIRTDMPNWNTWAIFFLRSLASQVKRLEQKVEQEKIILASVPELSLRIIEFVRSRGRLTISEATELTGANRNTIKVHIKKLIDAGHIVKHGVGKGVWYALI